MGKQLTTFGRRLGIAMVVVPVALYVLLILALFGVMFVECWQWALFATAASASIISLFGGVFLLVGPVGGPVPPPPPPPRQPKP